MNINHTSVPKPNAVKTRCAPTEPNLAVIVPALNAASRVAAAIAAVARSSVCEILVVDGGSTDATAAIAQAAGARVMVSERGRGRQLATGAMSTEAEWLLFLHADTVLDPGWEVEVQAFTARSDHRAAAFRFALDDQSAAARRLEIFVNLRCRVFKLPYGDQGLLISRRRYLEIGGFAPIPLFEDVDIIRRIGASNIEMLSTKAVTSAERFRKAGYLRRSLKNLGLLARYCLGASPEELARRYD